MVVGAGALGVKVSNAFQARGDIGLSFLGYFDDRADDRVDIEAAGARLGNLKQVAQYVREHGVHEVYITLPLGSQPRILELMEQVQGTTASVFFVPDVFGISIIQGRLQDMNGVPVVGLCETPFTGTNRLVKRLSDIVLASLILVLIAPVLAIIALGVRLTSPGPAIFRQRRNGLDGEEIIVYKFRSMRTQDNGTVVKQATKDDPRITPFGAFLRRTSLDELPQFINVLQGRMSIVGPRPHAVAHNEQYRQLIKAYMVRHKVKRASPAGRRSMAIGARRTPSRRCRHASNTIWNICGTGPWGWTCRSSPAPSNWCSSTATPTRRTGGATSATTDARKRHPMPHHSARTRRTLPAPAAALAAAFAATLCSLPAAAETSPYYVGIAQDLLARIEPAAAARRPAAAGRQLRIRHHFEHGPGGRIDQRFGRQRVNGSATLRTNRYSNNKQFNGQSYNTALALDWETIENLSGNVSIAADRTQRADLRDRFGQFVVGSNFETRTRFSSSVNLGMSGRWG